MTRYKIEQGALVQQPITWHWQLKHLAAHVTATREYVPVCHCKHKQRH